MNGESMEKEAFRKLLILTLEQGAFNLELSLLPLSTFNPVNL
jgi:hypothetical protein